MNIDEDMLNAMAETKKLFDEIELPEDQPRLICKDGLLFEVTDDTISVWTGEEE